jgi:hypothetical protein
MRLVVIESPYGRNVDGSVAMRAHMCKHDRGAEWESEVCHDCGMRLKGTGRPHPVEYDE